MKAFIMKAFIGISSLAVVVVGLVVTSIPTEAHHSSAPFYDDSKEVEVVGTVSRFNFRNPHSFIFIDAENADGEMVEFEVEMGSAVSMSRRGWTRESIKTGDPIKVVGQPSRAPGTHGVCCAQITRPDGSPIQLVRLETDGLPLQVVAFVPTKAQD